MRVAALPWPSKLLSPNARVHHLTKHKAVRAYRGIAMAIGRDDGRKPIQNPVCGVLPLVATRRRRDLDNILASLKSALDGLTDAGWWSDDHDIKGFHIIPEVYSKLFNENRIVILATEESDLPAMSALIDSFRKRVADGEANAAIADLFQH